MFSIDIGATLRSCTAVYDSLSYRVASKEAAIHIVLAIIVISPTDYLLTLFCSGIYKAINLSKALHSLQKIWI